MSKIEWNKVTKLSQIIALILFVGVFYWGFYLGRQVILTKMLGNEFTRAVFQCDNNKTIKSVFYDNAVLLNLDKAGEMYLLRTISASGARYANSDESMVFWNKGDTAFITEGDPNVQTYKNCVTKKSF